MKNFQQKTKIPKDNGYLWPYSRQKLKLMKDN